MIVFDIETSGLPEDQLREIIPPFDPAEVKLGNLKDEAKIAAKLKEAEANHLSDFIAKAALSPLTGRVIAVGVLNTDSGKFAIEDGKGDEAELLAKFWGIYTKCRANPGGTRKMAGWNILGFDLPFLVRRSWLHGVSIPATVRDRSDRYWDDSIFIDLMVRFAVGEWKTFVKLDAAARFFGVGAKNGDGKDFAKLWLGTAEEKQQAAAYLENDLKLPCEIAKRMGIA